MKLDTTTDEVILFAQRLVTLREPTQGYGDIGNTLIDYLRGEISGGAAVNILRYLENVYADDRAKTSKTRDLLIAATDEKRQEHIDQWTR